MRKIGLAWERQNSLGIGSVVLELCALFCCCFFPCRKKKSQFVPKPHEVQIKRSWVRGRPQHHDKDMGCLSKELYKWQFPGKKEEGAQHRGGREGKRRREKKRRNKCMGIGEGDNAEQWGWRREMRGETFPLAHIKDIKKKTNRKTCLT